MWVSTTWLLILGQMQCIHTVIALCVQTEGNPACGPVKVQSCKTQCNLIQQNT